MKYVSIIATSILYVFFMIDKGYLIIDTDYFTIVMGFSVLILALSYYIIEDTIVKKNSDFNKILYPLIFIMWIFFVVAMVLAKPEIIVGGATVVLVIVTGYNIHQTQINAEKMRGEEIKPKINIFIRETEHDQSIVDLIIENYGNGVAKDIRFNISDPEDTKILGNIKELGYFQTGINNLSPKKELRIERFYLNSYLYNINTLMESKNFYSEEFNQEKYFLLKILVIYYDMDKKEKTDTFEIQFNYLNYLKKHIAKTNAIYHPFTAPIDTSPPTDP